MPPQQASDLGNALWSARAAQKLAPRDEDVRALLVGIQNAIAAQTQEMNSAGAPILSTTLADFVRQWLTADELAWLVLGAWTMFTLLLLAGMVAMPGRLQKMARGASVVAGATFVAIGLMWGSQSISNAPQAVIVAPAVEMRAGPGSAFPTRFTLPAGVEVHTNLPKGGWAQIALANGTEGWAPAEALLVLR